MNKLPQRKNIRLRDYDYSGSGYYFITICSKDRKALFWKVGATLGRQFNKPPLSNIGEIINAEINKINSIYKNVEINNYVIMPNHIHMIIILHGESGTTNGPAKLTPTYSCGNKGPAKLVPTIL